MNGTGNNPAAATTTGMTAENAKDKTLNAKAEGNERTNEAITKERVSAIAAGKVGDRRGYEAKVTDWLISTAHVKESYVDKRVTSTGDKVNDPDAKKSTEKVIDRKIGDSGKVDDRLNIIKVGDRTMGKKMSEKRIKICVGNRAISVAKRKLESECHVSAKDQASVSDKRVKICVGGGVPKRRCDSANQSVSTVVSKQRGDKRDSAFTSESIDLLQDKPKPTSTVVSEKPNTDVKLTYKIGEGPSVGERRYLSGDRRNNPVFSRNHSETKTNPDLGDKTHTKRIDVATVKVRQILKQAKKADTSRITKESRNRVDKVIDRRHTVTDNKMSVTVRHFPIKKEEKNQTLAAQTDVEKQNADDTCQVDSGAAASQTDSDVATSRADGALPILVF